MKTVHVAAAVMIRGDRVYATQEADKKVVEAVKAFFKEAERKIM